MLVPQTAEYALRAMAFLALQPKGNWTTAVELSQETGVPRHYISKILRRLVTAELLQAQKGPGGGVALAKPSRSIRFADVLSAVDYESDPDHCAFGWGLCDHDSPCPLHHAWSNLKKDFHKWSKKTTLNEVAKNNQNYLDLKLKRKS